MKPTRKAADSAFESGANIKGTANQNDNPPKKTVSAVDKSVYTRKPAGVNSGNLPMKRQPVSKQGK